MAINRKVNLDKAETVKLIKLEPPIGWFCTFNDPGVVADPNSNDVGIMSGKADGKDKILFQDAMYISKSNVYRDVPQEIYATFINLSNKSRTGHRSFLYKGRQVDSYEAIKLTGTNIRNQIKKYSEDLKTRYPHRDFKSHTSWLHKMGAQFSWDYVDDTCNIYWSGGNFRKTITITDIIINKQKIATLLDKFYEDSDSLIELYTSIFDTMEKTSKDLP